MAADSTRGKQKLTPAQVGRAGEFFVAAEIHRRGGYAVTFAGNMPGIDIIASDADHVRRVTIQVKTRTSGTWHARVPRDAERTLPVDDESAFGRSLISAPTSPATSSCRGGGFATTSTRSMPRSSRSTEACVPVSPESSHHAIPLARIEQWRDRWDVLGILQATA